MSKYDWALDLDVADAEAPPTVAPRVKGEKAAQLELPQALADRLTYVDENDWFAVKDIPSATAANALIYKIRQHVRRNDNGLRIKVDVPEDTSVAKLLDLAREEKNGGKDTIVSLRLHVKQEAREPNKPKTEVRESATDELENFFSNA